MSSLVSRPALAFCAPAAFPGEAMTTPGRSLFLTDYAGRWLVLFRSPLDFTSV